MQRCLAQPWAGLHSSPPPSHHQRAAGQATPAPARRGPARRRAAAAPPRAALPGWGASSSSGGGGGGGSGKEWQIPSRLVPAGTPSAPARPAAGDREEDEEVRRAANPPRASSARGVRRPAA